MANSSFFKNTGTSTQIQGSANASAAAALASEQAALVSKNAAATSETNSAASAAAALVSKNAAATSAASANSDASAASISATASQTAATSSSANAALTSADATQTAADRVQTGLDRVATNSDAVQTAADRVQTGLDVTSSSASAAAALSSRNAAATSETNAAASAASSSADATATASDRVQTGLDAASTAADAIATAADRVQTGLDATASANSASAASTSATAAAASQVSAASSAASAAAVFNDFEDRYYGPHASDSAAQTHVTGLGLTVDQGDLYFNSTANEMRVYDGGAFIAASSAGGASLINYNYTATASQTAFTGADDNSNTLSYTVSNLIVTRNGVVLEDGTDYTATDGLTITLTVAAAAGDEINVVAFKSFTTADMVSATNGGAFQGNVDFAAGIDVTGNVTVTGTVDGRDVAADGTKLDGIEAGATADQTGAEIKASYEAEANTNAYTDAEKTKLTGIEASADVTDDTNVRAAGAVMTTGVSTLADSAYFKGAPTHGFRFNNNTDAFNNFIIRENGDTYTRGNAGIGTSSPNANLHTAGSSTNVVSMQVQNNEGTGSRLDMYALGSSPAIQSAHRAAVYQWTGSGIDLWSRTGDLHFGTSNAERLRITSDGTLQLTSNTAGANTLEASITAYNAPQAQVNSRIDFLTDTYQNTGQIKLRTNYGATTRDGLIVDEKARVTMPYQPAFHAHGTSSSWTVFSNGGWSTIVLPATTFNTGNHYNTGSSAFTAPVSGVFYFYFKIYGRVQSGGGASTYWQSRFQKNNSGISGRSPMLAGYQYNTGGADETITYSMAISLAANDQITLHAQSSGAYNGEYYPAACEFGGYLIG